MKTIKSLLLASMLLPNLVFAGHATDGERGNEMPPVFDELPKQLVVRYTDQSGEQKTYEFKEGYNRYLMVPFFKTGKYTLAVDPYTKSPDKLTDYKTLRSYNRYCGKNGDLSFATNEKILLLPYISDLTWHGRTIAIQKVNNKKSRLIYGRNLIKGYCYKELGIINTDEFVSDVVNHYQAVYKRMLLFASEYDYIEEQLREDTINIENPDSQFLYTKLGDNRFSSEIQNLQEVFSRDMVHISAADVSFKSYNEETSAILATKFNSQFEFEAYFLESALKDVFGIDLQRKLSKDLSSIPYTSVLVMPKYGYKDTMHSIIFNKFDFLPRWSNEYRKYLGRHVKGSSNWNSAIKVVRQDWDQSRLKPAYCDLKSLPENQLKAVNDYLANIIDALGESLCD